MLSLWELAQAVLLVVNGFAVLNEERFLAKVGLNLQMSLEDSFVSQPRSELRTQLAGFINATQYLRIPLIGINIVVVVLKLIIG